MPDAPLEDEDAQTLRTHWFRYLDTLEPLREPLYGYCRKLTGSPWAAEDLVQDTLLKGFGMTARGDFHGPDSPVRNTRAYLFRTATNLWLDDLRRDGRLSFGAEVPEPALPDADTAAMRDAVAFGRARTSRLEFASLLLKEVYDFSIDEIADFVGTTPGTVKSSLHRARDKVREPSPTPTPVDEAERKVAADLAEAINSRDVDRVLNLMAESLQIVVCNVGGGRGRSRLWAEPSIRGIRAEARELFGRSAVVMIRDGHLHDVLRVEADAGQLTRLTDYCYAPEVLKEAAASLGVPCTASAYHQPPDVLPGMIRTTALPWRTL